MGHKGVSVRKPKKAKPVSNASLGTFVSDRSGGGSAVQSLVKDKGAPFHRPGTNPSGGPNSEHKKGK